VRELRDAVRQWARTPVITAVVVLSLALGIGANTAIFSLIDSLLLKPLPVSDPGRIVRVTEARTMYHGIPIWQQISDAGLFESTAAMSLLRPDISDTPERRSAFGLAVSGTFFGTLGVRPAIGRLLTTDDDRLGSPAVAVTDYEFWQSQYGGRPDILGATIRLDGKPFTIVGVAERGFYGLNIGRRFDIAISLNGYDVLYPDQLAELMNSFSIVARLKPGQSASDAQQQLRAFQPQLRAALGIPDNIPRGKEPMVVAPMPAGLLTQTQEQYREPLRILMALVALVLVIACANVANLLLARGGERRGELAVRLSLGASRWSVMRAVLLESIVIALAGAVAAIMIGTWTARAIVNAVAVNQSGPLATWIDVPLDLRVLAFTIGAGVFTALAFGIGPAWRAVRVQPLDAMRQRGRGAIGGSSRFGIAQVLVAVQVALAFVLVLGGSLLVRSFVEMTTQDLGFDRRSVVIAVPDYSRGSVPRNARVPVSDRVREHMRSLPGVEDASLVESTPFGLGTRSVPYAVHGGELGTERVVLNRISDGYFRTMNIAMRAGRDFERIGREAMQSAIVNEAFANRHFAGQSPIGQAVRLGARGRPEVQIVGVVSDVRHASLREPAAPTLYLPFVPEDEGWIEIDIRSRLPEPEVRAAVLDAMAQMAPGTSVEFRSIEAGIAYAGARDRVVAWLAGGFAMLALLLSAIGLYGVMSHQVIRRRQEFGVRIAIGAAPASVTRLIVKQASVIIGIGLVVGLGGALMSGRLITALLYNVTPTDPVSIVAAAVFLSAVTMVAALIPARRASLTDPMTALREE
jgi:putative ABC transport system permease protein